MDRLEAVEVNSNALDETLRFDSQTFSKENLVLENILANGIKFENIVTMTDLSTNGSFKTVSNILNDGYRKIVPYIRSGNVRSFFVNNDELEHISLEAHKQLKKSHTFLHDILMARKGSIEGAIIILEDSVGFNSNENVTNMKLTDKNINPFYFVTFLNCKYGKKQIKMLSTGNVQPWVSVYQLKKLKFITMGEKFQSKIEETVLQAHKTLETSKTLYTEAQNLLLSELGLLNYAPTNKAVSVKSFADSFGTSGRLDAEYYQPKYDEIESHIKHYKFGYITLNNLIEDYSTGFPYKSDDYIENGDIFLIRINNIVNGTLDISNSATLSTKTAMQSPKDYVKRGDIIISMSGTIGSACCISDSIDAVINQRILKITPKNFIGNVLALYINSFAGYLQFERIGTGGVQTNISSVDMKKLLLPNLSMAIQNQIAEKTQQSFDLRKQSATLLENAKLAVEMAIEQGEDVAMKWLEGDKY